MGTCLSCCRRCHSALRRLHQTASLGQGVKCRPSFFPPPIFVREAGRLALHTRLLTLFVFTRSPRALGLHGPWLWLNTCSLDLSMCPRGEFAEPLARVLRAENNVQLQLRAPRSRRQERRGPAAGISSPGWRPGAQAEGSASWGLARVRCNLRELGSSRRLGGLSLEILILT